MKLVDVLPAVQQLPDSEKIELVRLLSSELCDRNVSPFEPFKTYSVPTPYNSFGAGAILMQSMSND